MRGSVYRCGNTWTYRFRAPEKDPITGGYPTISKGGFATENEAWKSLSRCYARGRSGPRCALDPHCGSEADHFVVSTCHTREATWDEITRAQTCVSRRADDYH
ncbi:Arm DNA-binding domain-containing protein [Mycolicibacterium gadium]|uniref:Arm DNA-binding domain-containing protein n=1 Tax=Mycolicibacterium gadium TaxID=1794 RepID=UPI001C65A6D7